MWTIEVTRFVPLVVQRTSGSVKATSYLQIPPRLIRGCWFNEDAASSEARPDISLHGQRWLDVVYMALYFFT